MSITFVSSINGQDIIVMPNPKFGNNDTINFKRINRTSRGNDLIIDVPDANWKPTLLHKYEWEYLGENKLNAMKAFVARNIGYPVFVASLYGPTWKVIFLRPDAEFAQVGVENRALTLDMQEVQ